MNATNYIKDIDAMLAKQRAHLLGQDIPFKKFLPRDGAGMSNEQIADYLASRVCFAMLRYCPHASAEDTRGALRWLYESILFLLEECPESDHTFGGV